MVNQKLIFHLVVFERNFRGFLKSSDSAKLSEFISEWCQDTGIHVLNAGCNANHLHLLFEQTSDLPLQQLMKLIVRKMEEWAKQNGDAACELDFGLFTVSYTAVDKISRFIESQTEHHELVSFEEEFVSLLDKHHVEDWQVPSKRRA